jgi:tetratricopeptide (TPR) repeat protein
MRMKHRKHLLTLRWLKVTALVLLAAVAGSAHAYLEGQVPTPEEFLLLPPYCQVKDKQGTPGYPDSEVIRWERVIGAALWGSLRHYCAGVNSLHRAYRTGGYARRRNLADALEQLGYNLKSPPAGNPLVPEMYLNRGIAWRLAGKDVEAARDYSKALELNPKLRKAYLELAAFFADKKQSAEALKIVTQGLRYLPGDKALQRRYTELGGKPPYPEPVEQSVVKEEEATSNKQDEEKPAPAASASNGKDTATPGEAGSNSPPRTPDNLPPAVSEKPKIGSPKNPWCRFCPPE